jgi:hypothetical protein
MNGRAHGRLRESLAPTRSSGARVVSLHDMAAIHLHGYSDQVSVQQGERIKFMVSVESASRYHADIVRLINGDRDPAGPGAKEEVISTSFSGEYPARVQPIYPGSHIVVHDRKGLLNPGEAISIQAFIMPITPDKGAQASFRVGTPSIGGGWALVIDDQQRLALWIGDGRGGFVQASASSSLMAGVWYSAGASYDRATRRLIVHLAPVVNSCNSVIGRLAQQRPPASTEIEAATLDFHCVAETVIAGWGAGTAGAGTLIVRGHEQLVFASTEAIVGRAPVLTPDDIYLYEHPELDLSTYDYHADGSGVCYVSRLRPIPNLRPHHRFDGFLWGLPADLCLIDWLEARGFGYDVVTDEDLHREGAAMLRKYSVVLTGTHPDYYSAATLDGIEDYLADGGRLMYLGGNGFYWVTSYHPHKPHIIEVRKGEDGSRAWQARPGEYYHSTTGERGGLLRNRLGLRRSWSGSALPRKDSIIRPIIAACPIVMIRVRS